MHGVKKERLSFDGLPLVSKSKVNSRKYITSDSLVVSSFSKFPTALRSPGKLPALIAKTAPIGISRKGTARAYRYKVQEPIYPLYTQPAHLNVNSTSAIPWKQCSCRDVFFKEKTVVAPCI